MVCPKILKNATPGNAAVKITTVPRTLTTASTFPSRTKHSSNKGNTAIQGMTSREMSFASHTCKER